MDVQNHNKHIVIDYFGLNVDVEKILKRKWK